MPERPTIVLQESITWDIPEDFKGIMNYNPRHDIQDYLDLRSLNGKIDHQEYADLLIQTNNRTHRQLEKAIGERFGVEKSTIEYHIDENGNLKSPDYQEPVVARYEKGRKFLVENGSTETERETAEVEGIKDIERILSDRDFPENQTVILVSPQGPDGSLYTENFFDVYQKKGGKITMTRYHSIHSLEGFLGAAQKLDPNFKSPQKDQSLEPAYFLRRLIKTEKTLPEVLETFALDTTAQEYKVNQQIIEACTPFTLAYIRTLIENPLDIESIKLTLNAIYNLADETEKRIQKAKVKAALSLILRAQANKTSSLIKRESNPPIIENLSAAAFTAVRGHIDYYGRQTVRTVNRGCPGGQKGFSISQSPLLRELKRIIRTRSVADFAQLSDEEVEDFQCPGAKPDGSPCTYIVRAYSGTRKCPECGTEATCG